MINLASACRKKEENERKNTSDSLNNVPVLSNIEDINKMIVMSGTAKRKPLQKTTSCNFGNRNRCDSVIQKRLFWNEVVELRAPCYKSRFKQSQTNEKLMNRSCEILFECIKPYKDVKTDEKFQTLESNQVTRSIFKMSGDLPYERKATRKVQFFSFCEETPVPFLMNNETQATVVKNNEMDMTEADFQEPPEEKSQMKVDLSPKSKRSRKTISSDDFIQNVVLNGLL